jgi:hypothetical protein
MKKYSKKKIGGFYVSENKSLPPLRKTPNLKKIMSQFSNSSDFRRTMKKILKKKKKKKKKTKKRQIIYPPPLPLPNEMF